MGADQKPKVFRLRQLPGDANKIETLVFLSKGLNGFPVDDIHIYSLATSLDLWRRSKTATLMFKSPPALTEQDKSKDEWEINVKGLERSLLLDVHFRGFTPLHDPSKHSFDCISISGLSSHPFGSWQPKKSDKTFMWIRDELPLDLPQVRPIIYGYETTLPESRSFQTITDLASKLINHLESSGWTASDAKPILFLAHSLGGLVFKRAIVALANTNHIIASRIAGGVFFGVPNFGMEQSSFLSVVQGKPNKPLVEELCLGSPWLRSLEAQFSGISFLQKMIMFWGYETCTSPTLLLNNEDEFMEGPEVVLVTPDSATRGLVKSDGSRTFPLNDNHSNIVKLPRHHEDYGVIVGKIAQICAITAVTVADRPGSAKSHALVTLSVDYSTQADGEILYALTESLKVDTRERRLEEIEVQFQSTFEWIFDKPEIGFVAWLQSRHGAFWINGSPGSGKSTLMKFIFKDPRTRELLHHPRKILEEVFVGFFFNHRGSSEQKSFDGLLRSILGQILEQCSRVCGILQPLVRVTGSEGITVPHWDVKMLKKALDMILEQRDFRLNIHLFLDALDEYHGPPESISRFVEALVKQDNTSFTHLKVCFSSRPWSTFTTRFKDYAAITIQDFTKNDIRRYCLGAMNVGIHRNVSSRIESLISQVVDLSKGVFLWVRLVASDLVKAAESGASKEALEQLLHSLPAELGDYYAEIIQRTSVSHRWTLYAMLEITARSSISLNAYQLLSAVECSQCLCYTEATSRVGSLGKTRMADRVRAGAQGLIEVRMGRAELLHQTVLEFIGRPDFSTLVLGDEAKITFENGYNFLAKWYLTGKFLTGKYSSFDSSLKPNDLDYSMSYAQMSEKSTGRSMKAFIDSVPPERYKEISSNSNVSIKSPLEFATMACLILYFQETIELHPEYLTTCDRSNQESLVSLALYLFNIQTWYVSGQINITGGYEFVRFILDNGHSIKKESKAFSQLINYLKIRKKDENWKRCVDLVIYFLELGQDANLSMTTRIDHMMLLDCKPLHISPPEIIPFLLLHGADPNAKDAEGMTPLDRLSWKVSPRAHGKIRVFEIRDDREYTKSIQDSYQIARILLEAGGKRTSRGAGRAWDALMDTFAEKGYDVERLAAEGHAMRRWKLPWQ